jgi:radical SAM superfamily enzyme YgiQ (UPF0313 family)/cytochrome c-type biogenesis protein CcmH/NrfG
VQVDLVDLTSDYIPLSLFYIKSYAETDPLIGRAGRIDVVVPEDASNAARTAAEIVARKPDVVGFSCYIWNMLHTMEIARLVKQAAPDTTVVVGGPDVSSVPKKALDTYPWIDVVVRGEGEETFRELLCHWLQRGRPAVEPGLRAIQGLGFREGGDIVLTDKRPFIENLDVIPSPYVNGCIDLKSEKRSILFETYRGCPFKCSFCYYPKDYGNLLHSFSMERVKRDLGDILASGAKSVFLMDPTFNVPPKRAKEILRFIAENRRTDDLSVTTELRVDLLDQEFMALLKQAGISVVEIGLQSSNDAALRAVDRKQSMRKITDNVRYLQSIGIEVVFQLIFGLPEDTYEDYLDSLDFCVGLDATKIEPYRLQLLPGTPMYDNAALLGLEFVDRGDRKIVRTRTMSKEDIERAEMLTRLLECFYDDKVARDAFKWLARHLGTSYARLLEDYMTWRLTLPSSLVAWREEGSRYIADFVRARVPGRIDAVSALVQDLLRYDRYTSPLHEIDRHVLVAFGHDVAAVAKGADGALPLPRETFLLFQKTDTASTNFFNGRFVRKLFREVPRDALASAERLAAAGLEPAEVVAVAEWHLAAERFDLAAAIARAVLAKAPREPDALHVLARTAAAAGKLDEALSTVKRAIKIAPDAAAYHGTLGNILAGAERMAEAIRAFEKAVALAPALVEPRFNLGVCLAHAGRPAEAVETLRALVEAHPDLAAGHFMLGEVLMAAGRPADAAGSYERTLALHPDNPDARQGLQAALQQMRRAPAIF